MRWLQPLDYFLGLLIVLVFTSYGFLVSGRYWISLYLLTGAVVVAILAVLAVVALVVIYYDEFDPDGH